ncbi:2-hydroxy-3-oxopropionate reductase [Salininema proteolyticum]|uniref:2-hydroxy-3-oxopropionate reductase n=1 Tax=Salininema proteolyticum TaxID=1607685 RepID=A0ABV8U3V9_9ACTN
MSKVGFIGLGIMGAPMAGHLVKAGHDVTVFDLDKDAVAKLESQGAKGADSIAAAVSGAEAVVTMVPADPHVEAVYLGEDGVVANAPRGALLVDMSTIRPDTSVKVGEAAKAAGQRFVDGPVSGGQAGAEEAVLSIMVGGEDADVEAARPYFEIMGKTISHVGPLGAGQAVKAANQLLVGGIIALNAEAIVLMEGAGVDIESGLDALAGGLAGSTVLQRKRENFLKRSYDPGFRIDLHHKDMGIIVESARKADVALPLAGQVAQLVASARKLGLGDRDHSALLAVIETINGRDAAGK